ncbi:transglutaminase family protein [Gramella sp. MAR_2010_147]|uniref:transglutaminase-like domain-containing protein n=1 Tax=Gramella sp. MAR_2010_147 TaxID=1250205 RepID=UPI000879BECB|nr:transglutaminase family protein [Gramella sp. MAR_2010_147]SDR74840.1 Transglutaminase-like enzyme, putative cysteine protease [Gramella sp. MAR_2010_147]
MNLDYKINYTAKNTYENQTSGALWQFLIIPEDNESQELIADNFSNSLNIPVENSINGYDFRTYRIRTRAAFEEIEFTANFHLTKKVVNIFEKLTQGFSETEYQHLRSLEFMAGNDVFLRQTDLTTLHQKVDFQFDEKISLLENLQNLNSWIKNEFTFKANVTDIDTDLNHILEIKQGVCQDFTHLFIAIAKQFGIPSRYVSGYLHQGNGYFGDSQMHAWVECCLPDSGWVGFDPTNNLIAAENHIKVAHGKDYSDCPPLKGVVFSSGKNETEYTVSVSAQQQQQQ